MAEVERQLQERLTAVQYEDGAGSDQMRHEQMARAREHEGQDQWDLIEGDRVGIAPELDVHDRQLRCGVSGGQDEPGHSDRCAECREVSHSQDVEDTGRGGDEQRQTDDTAEHARRAPGRRLPGSGAARGRVGSAGLGLHAFSSALRYPP